MNKLYVVIYTCNIPVWPICTIDKQLLFAFLLYFTVKLFKLKYKNSTSGSAIIVISINIILRRGNLAFLISGFSQNYSPLSVTVAIIAWKLGLSFEQIDSLQLWSLNIVRTLPYRSVVGKALCHVLVRVRIPSRRYLPLGNILIRTGNTWHILFSWNSYNILNG